MEASFEPLGGIIRVHPEGGLGEEYTWSCHVQVIGAKAILRGADSAPTSSEARAVKNLLKGMGVTEVIWDRRNVRNARKTRVKIGK